MAECFFYALTVEGRKPELPAREKVDGIKRDFENDFQEANSLWLKVVNAAREDEALVGFAKLARFNKDVERKDGIVNYPCWCECSSLLSKKSGWRALVTAGYHTLKAQQ